MPIYEYECQKCGKVSEFLLRKTDDIQIRCASCGSDELIRLISVPGVVKTTQRVPGTTCCGREERCDTPPCSSGGCCRH